MNKPLSIDELKSLKVGDWVWISRLNNKQTSGYVTDINFTAKMFTCKSVNRVATTARIADYGKTWLAYRNKQEAECKGEIVELPCTVGKDCYIVKKDKDGDYRMRTLTLTSYKVIAGNFVKVFFAKPKRYLMGTYEDLEAEHDTSMLGLYRKEWFTYIKEAERRLAELRGEK